MQRLRRGGSRTGRLPPVIAAIFAAACHTLNERGFAVSSASSAAVAHASIARVRRAAVRAEDLAPGGPGLGAAVQRGVDPLHGPLSDNRMLLPAVLQLRGGKPSRKKRAAIRRGEIPAPAAGEGSTGAVDDSPGDGQGDHHETGGKPLHRYPRI